MDIIQIISTLGFPIACCLALGWYVKTQTANYREDVKTMKSEYADELRTIRQEHKEETKQMTDALNNNTLVMQQLVDRIDRKETL